MDKGGNKATALFFLQEAATVSECGKVPQEEPENLEKVQVQKQRVQEQQISLTLLGTK